MGTTRKGIKIALGKKKKTHPFWSMKPATGEVIHDQAQNMQQWAVHCSTLNDRESSFMQHTLDAIKPLAVLEKPDSQPTLESSAQPWTPSSVAKHLGRINRISASL